MSELTPEQLEYMREWSDHNHDGDKIKDAEDMVGSLLSHIDALTERAEVADETARVLAEGLLRVPVYPTEYCDATADDWVEIAKEQAKANLAAKKGEQK
jgi:hypothetical protein